MRCVVEAATGIMLYIFCSKRNAQKRFALPLLMKEWKHSTLNVLEGGAGQLHKISSFVAVRAENVSNENPIWINNDVFGSESRLSKVVI